VRFIYPKNLAFTCNNCGICCGDTAQKTRHILLTETDAERIATQTCKPTATFANPTVNNAPYVYEMKKNPETGKCIFHQNSQCAIYTARPLICRFYPFQLTADQTGTHIFTETDECPQVKTCSGKKGQLTQLYFRKLLWQAQNELNPEPKTA